MLIRVGSTLQHGLCSWLYYLRAGEKQKLKAVGARRPLPCHRLFHSLGSTSFSCSHSSCFLLQGEYGGMEQGGEGGKVRKQVLLGLQDGLRIYKCFSQIKLRVTLLATIVH